MNQLLLDSLKSSVSSGLLILKFVVPLYVLADFLIYFDLLKYLGFLFAPFTSLLDLPGEQATVVPVAGAWTVTFPHAFAPNALADGAPETVTFEALADRGVQAVSLYEEDRLVYGPMNLDAG